MSLLFGVARSSDLFGAFESVLNRTDRTTTIFTRGSEALERLVELQPRLVVLGYDLDDLTAPEFCRLVRNDDSLRPTSLLFIGERKEEEQVDLCMAAGCNDIIFKPVDGVELDGKISRLTAIPVRREIRTLIKIEVRLSDGTYYMLGHSRNLSTHGMLVEVAQVLPPDSVLRVQFYLRGDAEPLQLSAHIVRAEFGGGLPRYGMQFDSLSERDRRRIANFVGRRTARELL